MMSFQDGIPIRHRNPSMASNRSVAPLFFAFAGCLLHGCSGGGKGNGEGDNSAPQAFNRVASFSVCGQTGSSCESDDTTAAEIVTASSDGMTLIYSNSPKGEIGFIDISNPASPQAAGALSMNGEPTSVAVRQGHVLVAVNTSANFVTPSGRLAVVDIATQEEIASLDLSGQPDSVAVSPDGRYVAVVIENERDEELGDGAPPQLPAGSLVIIDAVGAPSTWAQREVALTGLADLYPTDPEPEYVDINSANIAVVTLQENNHLVMVDLASGAVTADFSAGTVDLADVDLADDRPAFIDLSEVLPGQLREPDGVSWISTTQFVTANEGDLDGGTRGFTVFNTNGTVVYDSGNMLEHLVTRIGHYNDRRSDAKGNEPENAEVARFDGKEFLFVASERSSVVSVFSLEAPSAPTFRQVLPAGVGPEGVLAIPSRNLLVAASEEDDRAGIVRSVVNVYQYQSTDTPAYPTLTSVNRADGSPIPWAALSGLAASASNTLLHAIDDSFFRANRIFDIDVTTTPARIVAERRITDPNGVIAALAAVLPDSASDSAFDDTDLAALANGDDTVNLDPEGIAVASAGGFWVASEGNGTIGDAARPIRSANLILKVSATGIIEDVIRLPDAVDAIQQRFGFEGIAEWDGKLIVAFQRAWGGEAEPRIGIYDLTAETWAFARYPLEAVLSPNGGWVGLSDISLIDDGQFLVVERDNQGGPDARIKRLYRIDLTGVTDGALLTKTLVRDLMPDLLAPGGSVIEKVEGSAVLPNGEVWIVTDNDGVEGGSGETQFQNVADLRP